MNITQNHERDRLNALADRYELARADYRAAPIGSRDELLAYLEMSNALFERERKEKTNG